MSRIRSKNTRPEILVRSFLHRKGFRFRLHVAGLPGKPDIVLPKYKTVIFVHGCFWHGHPGCKYFVIPRTRTKWWLKKFSVNRANDKKHNNQLKKSGWRVLIIWTCEIGKKDALKKLSGRIK